jgi:hypothetical protein
VPVKLDLEYFYLSFGQLKTNHAKIAHLENRTIENQLKKWS